MLFVLLFAHWRHIHKLGEMCTSKKIVQAFSLKCFWVNKDSPSLRGEAQLFWDCIITSFPASLASTFSCLLVKHTFSLSKWATCLISEMIQLHTRKMLYLNCTQITGHPWMVQSSPRVLLACHTTSPASPLHAWPRYTRPNAKQAREAWPSRQWGQMMPPISHWQTSRCTNLRDGTDLPLDMETVYPSSTHPHLVLDLQNLGIRR